MKNNDIVLPSGPYPSCNKNGCVGIVTPNTEPITYFKEITASGQMFGQGPKIECVDTENVRIFWKCIACGSRT